MRTAALTIPTEACGPPILLLAHLCRCTGWHPILTSVLRLLRALAAFRCLSLRWTGAGRRAGLEGGVGQDIGAHVALGRGGFADDTAPAGALVAVLDAGGTGWSASRWRGRGR